MHPEPYIQVHLLHAHIEIWTQMLTSKTQVRAHKVAATLGVAAAPS